MRTYVQRAAGAAAAVYVSKPSRCEPPQVTVTTRMNADGTVSSMYTTTSLASPIQPSAVLRPTGSLSDVVAADIRNMSVAEVQRALQEAHADEKVWPFLLRKAKGEFHYGQRITRMLPEQRQQRRQDRAAAPAEPKPAQAPGELPAEVQAFNILASEAKFRHLHQVAGWVDLKDKSVWDNYVKDVMNGKVKPNDRIFEAGCGVLAFLTACLDLQPGLELGGVDGAPRTIELVKSKLVDRKWRENFFVGMLPDCMSKVQDDSWDVVVCNSVFQYMGNHDQAEQSVWEMLRVAKRWVIIADVCDSAFHSRILERQQSLQWAKDLQAYRAYSKEWWERFAESGDHLVSIRHVESSGYERRGERYVVYIEKNWKSNS
mmetsp:Transcript_13402/g.33568  ORF Transcript_13402/g.33568 Transcript_13402/m.33568 type:complete len:373 (+) Transcript_13402:31-1149(+)